MRHSSSGKSLTSSKNNAPLQSHLPVTASSARETVTPPHVTEEEAPLTRPEPPPTAHGSGPGSSAEEHLQGDFPTVSDHGSLKELEKLLLLQQEALDQLRDALAKAFPEPLEKVHHDSTPQRQPISSHTSPGGALANPSAPRPSRGVEQSHQGPPVKSLPTRDADDQSRRRVNLLGYGDQSNHERLPYPWVSSHSYTEVSHHSRAPLIQQDNLNHPTPFFIVFLAAYLIVFYLKIFFAAQ